jgi:hypothetical protein
LNDTVISAFENVTLHLEVTVLGAEMDIGGQHHLDVSFLLRELTGRVYGGSHVGWWRRNVTAADEEIC